MHWQTSFSFDYGWLILQFSAAMIARQLNLHFSFAATFLFCVSDGGTEGGRKTFTWDLSHFSARFLCLLSLLIYDISSLSLSTSLTFFFLLQHTKIHLTPTLETLHWASSFLLSVSAYRWVVDEVITCERVKKREGEKERRKMLINCLPEAFKNEKSIKSVGKCFSQFITNISFFISSRCFHFLLFSLLSCRSAY